jgi:hypothetical protein
MTEIKGALSASLYMLMIYEYEGKHNIKSYKISDLKND